MAQIDKSLAPFTYTGTWDINEYSPGLFYARFFTSGTLTPKQPFTCDAFLVGGGGGGGRGLYDPAGYGRYSGGGGGGGGYIKNIYQININSNTPISVGSGGSAGNTGGATSFGSHGTASGGGGGKRGNVTTPYPDGGNGGSGGGAGGLDATNNIPENMYWGGSGGSNGADGTLAYADDGRTSISRAGKGGGATTRPFNGTSPFQSMYFSGGGGGGCSGSGGSGGGGSGGSSRGTAGSKGTTNTGGGGGGGGGYAAGGTGGSGIVIIRGVLNLAPTIPDGITYSQPNAGKSLLLTTGGSTDPEGNPISYVWEHRTDSGVYTQIGVTTEPQITATVPTSGTTYQARVKAVDNKGAVSGYTTGIALPINYYQTFVGGLDSTPIPVSKIIIAGHEVKAGWVGVNGQIKRIDSI